MKRRTPKSRISLSRRMIPVILCCLLLLSAFPVSAYAETVDVKQAFTGKCVSNGRLSIINAVNQLYTENRGAYSLGDVNGDGYITSADATLARQIVMNTVTPSAQQSIAIDVNKDGTINIADYTLINRFVLRTNYFSPV